MSVVRIGLDNGAPEERLELSAVTNVAKIIIRKAEKPEQQSLNGTKCQIV